MSAIPGGHASADSEHIAAHPASHPKPSSLRQRAINHGAGGKPRRRGGVRGLNQPLENRRDGPARRAGLRVGTKGRRRVARGNRPEAQSDGRGDARPEAAAQGAQGGAGTAVQTPPSESVQPQAANKDILGFLPSPIEGLKLGMYGEFKFGMQQNPDRNGQWQSGFDAARIVLLPSFQFTDSIIFNAEIEFEHAGFAADADDKINGAVGIEQAWVDFKVNPYFNVRSPGIDLVPVGYTNLFHEPTLFYSVNRPTLANGLIPTTWSAPAMSVYGKIVDNLYYQVQVSSSLEDFGSGFDARTDGNSVPPFPEGYDPGISGKTALGLARPPLGDFRQLTNAPATAVRLSYTPPFIPGLAGSTSVYYTPSTTPRGAYSDTGTTLKRSSLTLIDSEVRYRLPVTGFECRGEYVQSIFGSPANLRANNDTDPTDNVGRTMWG